MQDSADWFGFTAYDLHGSWATDVKTLGSMVRGQTDIRDISNDTVP
jgi:chitinase